MGRLALALVASCSSCRSDDVVATVAAPRVAIYDDDCTGTPPTVSCQHPNVRANCADGWCSIPKGCFIMGSPECEWGRGRNSENENETTLTHDFLMKQTEVTQAEWTSLGLTNPSKTSDAPRLDCADPTCPVGNVNWYEALEFANRLSTAKGKRACYALEGCSGEPGTGMTCSGARALDTSVYECEGYRLPTEAEWEYAARAGSRWATYAGDLHARPRNTECAPENVLDPIAW